MKTFLFLLGILGAFTHTCESQNQAYFLHLTDLHYDPWYNNPTAGISCNEPIENGGIFGDFECDSPWKLVVDSVHALRNLGTTDVKFLLWSGDNPPHVYNKSLSDWVNTTMIKEITRNLTTLIQDTFPDMLVLPMVGNHDYYPKNQLPGESNELYDAYLDMWSDWLGDADAIATFRRGAYYSRLVSEEDRIHAIVLNNNLYYSSNRVTAEDEDPGGQLAWFQQKLADLREAGEKAYLFYHVPFGKVPEPTRGKGWLVPKWNTMFATLIEDNADLIIAGSAVHAHSDVYKIYYKDDEPVSALFISPSVTPWRVPLSGGSTPPHNPAVRRYVIDPDTFEITDYEQYSLDLAQANDDSNGTFSLLYKFTTQYGTNLDPRSLHELLERMKMENSEVFQTYYDSVYVDTFNDNYVPCSADCKRSHLCAIQHVNYDEFDACYDQDASGSTPDPVDSVAALTSSVVTMFASALILSWLR